MTDPNYPVKTREEFHRRLSVLVASAVHNGVDVRGGYACQAPPPPPYDVVITRLDATPPD